MKLKEICPICNKDLKVFLNLQDMLLLSCGHKIGKDKIATRPVMDTGSLDGTKEAYQFQVEGLEFLYKNNFCGLIGDAMGLGKTIQALLALKNEEDLLTPSLVLVKSATTLNWAREIKQWVSKEDNGIFIISGAMPFIPRGFKIYIMSQDSLALNMKIETNYRGDVTSATSSLFKLGLKSIVVDECHGFKNEDSNRTKALIGFLKFSNIKHKIFLSGTPIKNRANEYFVTLNLLAPEQFQSKASFQRNYLIANDKGVYSRIHPNRMETFKKVTAPFILRREKSAVTLPPFSRNIEIVETQDKRIKNTYNAQLQEFQLKMDSGGMSSISILGEIAKLRHICGIAKIPYALEFAEEFFENADLEKSIDRNYPNKLALIVHHHSVRQTLKLAFDSRDAKGTNYNAMTLSGEDSALRKQSLVDSFTEDPNKKVLILSGLAGGVGLNIQACANMVGIERFWSAADEEQVEARFLRNGQKYPVAATYPLIKNSIDEFFNDMVEEKRRMFGETVQWSLESDSQSMKELVERTLGSSL